MKVDKKMIRVCFESRCLTISNIRIILVWVYILLHTTPRLISTGKQSASPKASFFHRAVQSGPVRMSKANQVSGSTQSWTVTAHAGVKPTMEGHSAAQFFLLGFLVLRASNVVREMIKINTAAFLAFSFVVMSFSQSRGFSGIKA